VVLVSGEEAIIWRGIGNLRPDDYRNYGLFWKAGCSLALYGSKSLQCVIRSTTQRGSKGGGWSVDYTIEMMAKMQRFTDFQQEYNGQRYWSELKPGNSMADAQSTGRCLGREDWTVAQLIGFDAINVNQYPLFGLLATDILILQKTGTNGY